MKTVLDVIQGTTGYFEKNGVENPRFNAEWLLANALGKKRMELYLEFDRPLSESELAPLREVVRKRAAGHPLQHLLGTVEFFQHEFLCDARALIPRPETEHLVDLLAARETKTPARIVDVGTGSGVIALSLAAHFPEATVEAVDISPEALSLAKENCARLGLEDRVRFYEGNLLEPVAAGMDWVIANLPYIESDTISGLAREVQHDPRMALDGGADGLDFIRRLIPQAKEKLSGLLALEIGASQSETVRQILKQAGFQDVEILPDYQQIPRFVFGRC